MKNTCLLMIIFFVVLLIRPSEAIAACDYSKILVFEAAYRNDVNTILQGKFTIRDLNQKFPDGACQGWAPIIIAAAEGHAAMVKVLISKGVDVNATNAYGRTALMFASKYGYLDIVRALLNAHADPNLKPKEGPNAILAAGEEGKADIIKELLKYGSKISSADCTNQFEVDACARIAVAISVFQSDYFRSTNLIKPFCTKKTEHQQSICNIIALNACYQRHPQAITDKFVDYWLDSGETPIVDIDFCIKH